MPTKRSGKGGHGEGFGGTVGSDDPGSHDELKDAWFFVFFFFFTGSERRALTAARPHRADQRLLHAGTRDAGE